MRQKEIAPRLASLEERISAAMFHNAGLFLKKAAEEIAGHPDSASNPFDLDRSTLVTVLTQTAVELVSTATVLKYEGLAAIVRSKNLPASATEAEAMWAEGTIRTLTFEDLKSKAEQYFGDEAFWDTVELLQRSRNKLVHFHIPLVEGDRFDLKYDATHVVMQIIVALTGGDEDAFAFDCRSFLGHELFDKLLSYEPYRDGITRRAQGMDPNPLACGACGVRAFLRDEEICLACGYSGEVKLLRCVKCRELAVFYDHLNLPFNSSLAARCGKCGWVGRAAHCLECGEDYLIDGHGLPDCPQCRDK